ncbi:DegT/DnrJ/EryC1/StrS family aminotransferase [Shimia sp.]|uniref:DegT/DnrJ/EryC1/StrS family aminotransferase n=1 Tax=Shimia sp. TaxID=1954381 RepID=UPI0032998E15
MYLVGNEEIDALAKVIREGTLFRYGIGQECDRFESRYADYLNTQHVALTVSGTYALTAAMRALSVGPGDEVLVPAHTYMATATSVLAVGAIPVVVDIDESLTISPTAIEAAVGPRTRAVIAVHMWGAACNMDAITELGKRHQLWVIEDACQGVGGGYKGQKLGAIGDIGAFSFNFYKNMTCGEGGAIATSDASLAGRARCAIDPCHYYWNGQDEGLDLFAGNGGRASELQGAMLNVQLDRIDGIVSAMRKEREYILQATEGLRDMGLTPALMHSPDFDCAAHLMFQLPTAESAKRFAEIMPVVIASETGRHTYTKWEQVLQQKGAAHPAMNPYNHPANADCRLETKPDQCARSLKILDRMIMVPMSPLRDEAETAAIARDITHTARAVLGNTSKKTVKLEASSAIDTQKFDIQGS